jgi:membrane protein YdbS with pleckstrin-like domain
VDTIQRLHQVPIFDILSDQDKERWAVRFRRERYGRGDVIVRQGEPVVAFYIVDEGELRGRATVDGEEVPRRYFYPGQQFGAYGLLTGQPNQVTISVLTDAELLVLDKTDFAQLVEEQPEMRQHLLAAAQQRRRVGEMRFDWQDDDEVTILFSTKHWIALARALRLPIVLGLIGLVATAIYVGSAGLGNILAAALAVVAGSLWALTVFLAVYDFFDWRNDSYIITNRRVLHVERVLLLREDRDEAPIDRVQDVQLKQRGVLANLLKYGDLLIQTAAATERIMFTDIPHPKRVQNLLFGPLGYTREQERAEMREAIRQALGQRLKILPSSPEGDQEPSADQEPLPPADETVPVDEEPLPQVFRWLRNAWRWLGRQFTFETRIVTDGGNTVTWRKNGWLLVRQSLLPSFLGLLALVFFVTSLARGIGVPAVPMVLLLTLILLFGWWFYRYWDWQNDIYQISGNRLVDLKKRPLFLAEMRRETTLDRVQNISLSIPGPIAQLLNYGTVVIETAGETGAFFFAEVHDPRSVQSEIFSRRERVTREQEEAERLGRQKEWADWFEIYEELKHQQRTV